MSPGVLHSHLSHSKGSDLPENMEAPSANQMPKQKDAGRVLDPSTVRNIPPPPQQPRDPLLVPACGWRGPDCISIYRRALLHGGQVSQWVAEAGTGWRDLVVLGLSTVQ